MALRFRWDALKAAANLRKHGVAFTEAVTVFGDPLASIHADPDHSMSERREIIAGHSAGGRLLLVCFTERHGVVRIISARRATPRERKNHEESTND